jgi:hypothetical protein
LNFFSQKTKGKQMSQISVTFHNLIQDSQEFGSDDEHMVSRVFFTIEVEGNSYPDMYCNLKQTVGSDFESGPIEVGTPQGAKYSGPFNYDAFREAVEGYYRGNVGSSGSGIGFGTGERAYGCVTIHSTSKYKFSLRLQSKRLHGSGDKHAGSIGLRFVLRPIGRT